MNIPTTLYVFTRVEGDAMEALAAEDERRAVPTGFDDRVVRDLGAALLSEVDGLHAVPDPWDGGPARAFFEHPAGVEVSVLHTHALLDVATDEPSIDVAAAERVARAALVVLRVRAGWTPWSPWREAWVEEHELLGLLEEHAGLREPSPQGGPSWWRRLLGR